MLSSHMRMPLRMRFWKLSAKGEHHRPDRWRSICQGRYPRIRFVFAIPVVFGLFGSSRKPFTRYEQTSRQPLAAHTRNIYHGCPLKETKAFPFGPSLLLRPTSPQLTVSSPDLVGDFVALPVVDRPGYDFPPVAVGLGAARVLHQGEMGVLVGRHGLEAGDDGQG